MPTPRQMQINMLQDIGGVLYVSCLFLAIVYTISWIVKDIKEYRVFKKIEKENVEWILDFDGELNEVDS